MCRGHLLLLILTEKKLLKHFTRKNCKKKKKKKKKNQKEFRVEKVTQRNGDKLCQMERLQRFF